MDIQAYRHTDVQAVRPHLCRYTGQCEAWGPHLRDCHGKPNKDVGAKRLSADKNALAPEDRSLTEPCEKSAWCERGFKHRGQGGKCSRKRAWDDDRANGVAAGADSLTDNDDDRASLNSVDASSSARSVGASAGAEPMGTDDAGPNTVNAGPNTRAELMDTDVAGRNTVGVGSGTDGAGLTTGAELMGTENAGPRPGADETEQPGILENELSTNVGMAHGDGRDGSGFRLACTTDEGSATPDQ